MDESASSDRDRIEALEALVLALHRDVVLLRAEVSGRPPAPSAPRSAGPTVRADPAPPVIGRAPTPYAPARRLPPAFDFERIVGRYGTIAVATVAILLGVGAFLQWAIARGLLGPEVRVALGALAALVIAAVGMRLRERGTVRFGNILLALALAVVHVDAWAAGPSLHLIPGWLALVVVATASATLAALALSEREQSLFAIGLGGALLAPFVTSDGGGSMRELLSFGWLVSTAAIAALRESRWQLSRRLVALFGAIYVGAAFSGLGGSASPAELRLPTLFALAVAISALVLAEPAGRRALTRTLLVLMALSLMVGSGRSPLQWDTVALALIGTLAVHAMRRRAEVTAGGDVDTPLDAVVLPLGFMLVGLMALEDPSSWDGAKVSSVWAALAGVLVVLSPSAQRAWHLTVMFTAIQVGILLGVQDQPLMLVLSSAALACAVTVTLGLLRGRALLLPLAVALFTATTSSHELLVDRLNFGYTPFMTRASVAALGTVIAWIVFSRLAPSVLFSEQVQKSPWADHPEVALVRSAGAVVAFFWVREELRQAFSPDIATFLLISFYAAAGVAAIGVGRVRSAAGMRQTGLVLALYAALKAVLQASDLSSVGLRVGSYLVVGVFLLGVGYWYRATTGDSARADGTPAT